MYAGTGECRYPRGKGEKTMNITPRQSTATHRPANRLSILSRAFGALRWPFTSRYAAPLWLALRLYIGWIFLQMGLDKIEAGWLRSDPSGDLLKLVANGTIPIPFAFYRGVADLLVGASVTPLLSYTMPLMEIAVALAFCSGVLVPAAAAGAILLNINFILSGIGQIALDGPIIVANILLILSYRVVGVIGFEKLALRPLKAAIAKLRPGQKAAPARR
jgi:thiosulfate dehydrogenase [quinone] large subunit